MNEFETITLNEVPKEIFDQITTEGWQLNLDTYGEPYTTDCTTRAVDHVSKGQIERYGMAMDPATFAPVIWENAQVSYRYKIRGVFNNEMKALDLYSVSGFRTLTKTPKTIVHTDVDPTYHQMVGKK
jgi:hypothetical protein